MNTTKIPQSVKPGHLIYQPLLYSDDVLYFKSLRQQIRMQTHLYQKNVLLLTDPGYSKD